MNKEEEERIALEKELLEQQQRLTKLTSSRMSGEGSVEVSESETEGKSKRRKRYRNSPGKKAAKKSRSQEIDSEDDDSCEEFEDPLDNIEGLVKKLKAWVTAPANVTKVTKPQAEKLKKYADLIAEEIVIAREERARQETRVKERSEIGKMVREVVREEVQKIRNEKEETSGTYSQAVRSVATVIPPVTGSKPPVMQPPKQVIVKHDTKDSLEVTKELKRLVVPSRIGLKVRRLVHIRNGVIVEAETDEGVDNLLAHVPLREAGLKVERPTKKKPVVMIYDVGADLKDEEIKDEVYHKNMQDSEIGKDEFMQEFTIRYKHKDKRTAGRKVHLVVETSVRVRNWLRRKEGLFIEWQCCRVKDYVDVARCYKCQRYGHIAKYCENEKPSCSHCAGEHVYKDCPDKNKKEKECCANCKRDGAQNSKHNVASKKCPAFNKAVKKQYEKTDYGY